MTCQRTGGRRLFALDLDGTLLPRSKVLGERTKAAIGRARDAGAEVVLATGKTFHLAADYAAELSLTGPLIAQDGALVRDGTVLLDRRVPGADLAGVEDRLAGLSLRPFLADASDGLLIHEALEPFRVFLSVYSARTALTPDPLRDREGDPYFLGYLGPPDHVRRGAEALGDLSARGLSVFAAGFYERGVALLVIRPDADKGRALALVADHLGYRREEVVAAGDWVNDVGMVAWAGTGVAMADAHPDVVAVADVVLPGTSEDEALSRFIEEVTPRPGA